MTEPRPDPPRARWTDVDAPTISDREFERFQALILREAGIFLAPCKKALLVGRLSRRLRQLGLDSFHDYYERVASARDAEFQRMLDLVTTNETRFFREPHHFEFLSERILPELERQAREHRRPRRIRIWSAGCASGEEPYSIAMVLRDRFPEDSGWHIEVVATDLSTRALEQARSATWPIERTGTIPPRYLSAFMLRGVGSQAGRLKVGEEIRRLVRFQRLNLNDPEYPGIGMFEVVFFRNVLMYFGTEVRERVVDRILGHLRPEGHLFMGHADGLNGTTRRVRRLAPAVYVHAPEGESSRRGEPLDRPGRSR